VQGIPIREKLFIGGDLNRHVGTSRYIEDLILGKEMNQLIRF